MLILKKLLRDMWLTRGRALSMVAAIAVGLFAFNTLVGAYSVLTREVVRNYMDSRPAAIILEMDDVDDETLAWVKQRPDVEAATRRARILGRFSTPTDAEKRRALVFVVDDFEQDDVARIFSESGAFPPTPGTVLMERSAISVVGEGEGATLFLDLPGVSTKELRVSGIVHEPALAPANTEQALYAYLSRKELLRLGVDVPFDELRLTPKGPKDVESLEAKARELSQKLRARGLGEVTALRVPPPGRHPHQTQMTTVLSLFLVFSLLIVVLSSLLTASLLSTMMARQVREIGIMKTLGASRRQIYVSYVLLVQAIALAAYLLAWIPSKWGAELFVDAITRLLNFDVLDPRPSTSARFVQLGVAALVPLLVSLPAISRGSRVSVMRALVDYGVKGASFGDSRSERWAAKWGVSGGPFVFALRAVLRRRGRFLLSVALLASAGGIFLSANNTAQSWEVVTQSLYTSRHYDFEVDFSGPVDGRALSERLERTAEIDRVESWLTVRTAPGTGHALPLERTYPDGAHGAFSLVAAPNISDMVDFEVKEGRLPRGEGAREVVLNQVVPGSENVKVGESITLSIEGTDRRLRVVGKVEEVGTGAVAYVSQSAFVNMVPKEHRENSLRIRKAEGVSLSLALETTNRVLVEARAPVTQVSPLAVFENAVAAHFEVLVSSLLALAAVTGFVGTMGLVSALSANVVESTREMGVLRALGASGRQIRSLVTRESLMVSGLSFLLAVLMGQVLTAVVGDVIGRMSFRLPLPWTVDVSALLVLFVGLIGLGALSSILPARRASSLTVAEALRVL